MPLVPTSLVTGGAGFLGSHLCDALLAKGHRVICVDNVETGSLASIEHHRTDEFVFMPRDLTHEIRIDEPVDFVYHLASPASPIDYLRLPLQTLKVGSYGTHNALGLAKFKRARFLLASTSEVYGDPQVHPQPEVIEIWGSSSEIVHEALPTDDPKQREPDITRARQLLGWEPEIPLDDGLRRLREALPSETIVV